MDRHSTTSPYGALTALHGDVLQGWAFDPACPALRLAVEIYIDHVFVALVRADLEQGLDAEGDGFHGFAVQLRKSWLEKARHIAARIANQGPWLDGTLLLSGESAPAQNGPLASQVLYSGGLRLRGWAWDGEQPARHVRIRVREGDTLLGETLADRPHPALIYRDTTDHGFEIDLPWEIADGQPHELHIENDRGEALTGSPLQLCLHPEGLTRLLAQHTDRHPEQAEHLELIQSLSETQDLLFPRSAGFEHYPQWHALFQQAPALQATRGDVLILLQGSGDEEAERISRASIDAQRLDSARIRIVAPSDAELPAQLHRHLDAVRLIVPLQCGDRLAPHALDTLLASLESSGADWLYADCDQDDASGRRSNPWLKPAWDETLFYAMDLITPGAAFSSAAVRRAMHHLRDHGPLDAPHWHLLLAGIVLAGGERVRHLPQVLYHRRSDAPASPHRLAADPQRQRALQWLAEQRCPGARVAPLAEHPGLHRTHWPLPARLPSVSLIVPTRDQVKLLRACIEGLLSGTDYPALEIIVVDNDSREPETHAYLADIARRGVRVLPYPQPFNYAAINNWALEQARGEIVGLINNDIEVLDVNWLREMLAHLLRPGIGAVGAKLLWPNGMLQHGGVVVGINGLAAHTGNFEQRDDPGYLGFNLVAREQSAVTAACLLLRKHDFQRLDGLDPVRFPVAFNDVDLCLRLREAGLRLVWTPFAQLIHAESASRGKEDTPSKAARAGREQKHFIQRWASYGKLGDPYYHPALSHDYLAGPYGGLAIPPRQAALPR